MTSSNFKLELHSPDGTTQSFDIKQKIIVGTSDDADIKFEDPALLDYHCAIKVKNNVIAIHNLAGDGETKVDQHSLGKGKMYLLSPGDKIQLGEYFLLIVRLEDEVAAEEIDTPPAPADDIGDSTAPSIVMTEEQEVAEEPAPPVQDLTSSELTAEDLAPEEIEGVDELDETNPTLAGFAMKADFDTEGMEDEDEYEGEQGEEEFDEEGEEYDDEDLKMLEAIQEGRQPKGNGDKTSFFRRIFRSGKIKEDPVKKEKELFQRMPYPCPGFMRRILALITNVAICYALVFTVFPPFHIDDFLLEQLAPVLTFIGPHLTMINPIPLIYMVITFAFLEIVSALLLGAPIPYFLMGIKSNDREMARRVKGTIRALIGLVTLPLIIFDLPALVGKPTVKEVITRTRLGVSTSGFISFFSTFFIVFPLIGICLLSPFALDMEHITGIDIQDMVKRKANKVKNLHPVKGTIHKFKLTIDTELAQDLELLPHFTTTKKMKILSPSLILLSSKKKKQAYLRTASINVDFKELVMQVYTLDPFFPMNYPTLTTWVTTPDDEGPKIKLSTYENEFEKLLRLCFGLTPPTYVDFISQTGPFPSGYLILREKLLSLLGVYTPHTAVFTKSRMSRFAALLPNKIGLFNSSFYINFKTLPPQLFEIKYSKKSKSLARLMERDILQNSTIGETAPLLAKAPYNTFEMMDIVNNKLHLEEESSPVFEGISAYYSTKFVAAEQAGSSYTKKYILKSLRSLIKALQTKYKGNKLEKITPLLNKLIELEKNSSGSVKVQKKVEKPSIVKPGMPQDK